MRLLRYWFVVKPGYIAPMNIFHIPPTGLPVKVALEGMNEARVDAPQKTFTLRRQDQVRGFRGKIRARPNCIPLAWKL